MMNRRSFIQKTLTMAMLSIGHVKVWAMPNTTQPNPPRLLVILLRGAYDGNSLLVPHGFPYYYSARPTIAIASPNASDPASAIDIGQGYGLHPVLANTIYPLYRQQQVAFVPFSGSQDISRSHFGAQDIMELGQPASTHPDYASGFLNRLVEVLQGRQTGVGVGGIAFTNNLPLSFKGRLQIPNISLNGEIHDIADNHQSHLLESMYANTPLNAYLQSSMMTRHKVAETLSKDSDIVSKDMLVSARGAAKPGAFASVSRKMSALMRDNPAYSIGFVDIGGWDSHVNQGNASGMLANDLNNLAQGLTAFIDEMGATAWKQTAVIVMSEFGRTFHENGTRGTDHGHGNTLWVLGGQINGGRLAGELANLDHDSLFQQRDTPVLNDYRGVLADLMREMYGLGNDQLLQIFPGAPLQHYHLT